MDNQDVLGLLIDVRYALKQLREFRDVGRAVDALERVEAKLEEPLADMEGYGTGLDCDGRRL